MKIFYIPNSGHCGSITDFCGKKARHYFDNGWRYRGWRNWLLRWAGQEPPEILFSVLMIPVQAGTRTGSVSWYLPEINVINFMKMADCLTSVTINWSTPLSWSFKIHMLRERCVKNCLSYLKKIMAIHKFIHWYFNFPIPVAS